MMGLRKAGLSTVYFLMCMVALSGCANFPSISHLHQQNDELTYEECTVTILNTLLFGLYAWTSDCKEKTLKLK